jgi:hypothetical protein
MSDPTSSMPSSWLALQAKIDLLREPDQRQFLTFQASWYSFLIRATEPVVIQKHRRGRGVFPIFSEQP